jgi:hypothetical protein
MWVMIARPCVGGMHVVRSMQVGITILAATVLLQGCGQREQSVEFAPSAAPAAAPMMADGARKMREPAMIDSAMSEPSAQRTLAYEHSVLVATPTDKIQATFEAVHSTCLALSAGACAVLESRLSTGEAPNAVLRLRLAPSGIPQIFALLNQGGKVVEQASSAEDLAGPMADTQRHLALKTDYRAKLEELRKVAARDIDALIKINQELANVQSEIEALAANKVAMRKRVDTEVLNITLSGAHGEPYFQPIVDALNGFGANLVQGVAAVLVALSFFIPWALLLVCVAWGARKLWARRQRKS